MTKLWSFREEESMGTKNNIAKAEMKERLYGRVEGECCYCRDIFPLSQMTIEHIIPKSFGGTNHPINLTLACAPCNESRDTKTTEVRYPTMAGFTRLKGFKYKLHRITNKR